MKHRELAKAVLEEIDRTRTQLARLRVDAFFQEELSSRQRHWIEAVCVDR